MLRHNPFLHDAFNSTESAHEPLVQQKHGQDAVPHGELPPWMPSAPQASLPSSC